MRNIPSKFAQIVKDLQSMPSPEQLKFRQDESLTQLPQSSDYRHTIDVLQAKVWLYQSTTVGAIIALLLSVFAK